VTRSLVSRVLFFLALALSAPIPAAADDCQPDEALKSYLEKEQVPCGTKLLLYDHTRDEWAAKVLQGKDKCEPVDLKSDLALDLNGKPRLSLNGRDQLRVLVVDTNPMLYEVDPGETVEVDVESLAQFEQLARLIGGNLTEAARLAQRFTPIPRQGQIEDVEVSSAFRVETAPELMQDDVGRILVELRDALSEKTARLAGQLQSLQDPQGRLIESSHQLQDATYRTRAYMRAVESSREIRERATDIGQSPPQGAGLAGLDDRIDLAARDLAAIDLESPSCVNSHTVASAVLARKISGFSASGSAAERAAFQSNLGLLQPLHTGVDGCSPEEQHALESLATWLMAHPPAAEDQDPRLLQLKQTFDDFLQMATHTSQAKTAIADLLGKAPAAAKGAEALQSLIARESANISTTDGQAALPRKVCSLSAGVIEVFAGDPDVRILKVQQRKFDLKASAPLAADLERHHADNLTAVPFELDSRLFNDFSFGFGAIRTKIADPTWGAVQDPRFPNDDKKKVIARTDEETRSGDVALLMSFVPGRLLPRRLPRLGIDVGAAIDTDHPGALLGLSTGLGRFVRFGVGYAWFRVKELDDGQDELRLLPDGSADPASLTSVSSSDDIRTHEAFKGKVYFSLTFSLDALPFFRPEE
jgi:hypothetical protein